MAIGRGTRSHRIEALLLHEAQVPLGRVRIEPTRSTYVQGLPYSSLGAEPVDALERERSAVGVQLAITSSLKLNGLPIVLLLVDQPAAGHRTRPDDHGGLLVYSHHQRPSRVAFVVEL